MQVILNDPYLFLSHVSMILEDTEEDFESTRYLSMFINPEAFQKIDSKLKNQTEVDTKINNSHRSLDPNKRNEQIHTDIIKAFGTGFSDLNKLRKVDDEEWEDGFDVVNLDTEQYDVKLGEEENGIL